MELLLYVYIHNEDCLRFLLSIAFSLVATVPVWRPVSDFRSRRPRASVRDRLTFSVWHNVALDILKHYPQLAMARDGNGETALHVLARKPSAFTGGSRFGVAREVFIPEKTEQNDLKQLKKLEAHLCRKVGHDKSLKQAQAFEPVRL
ncbi:hypothetical protein HYC85_025676 [Camellia sinensis]|uniref:PGG domain-containing protein n=1 Tax=Camellia sinensis TaxID=4442 RepID=A0A7J7GBR6_CAMSI|nr:hypothetical protein HYC85_025676 [Camellia sinensis]